MPRRVNKNVFDVARQDAGDRPTITAPEPEAAPLGGLLQRVSDDAAMKRPVSSRRQVAALTGASEAVTTDGEPRPVGAGPRGRGGRPAGAGQPAGRITVVPARVPTPLYAGALDLVKGRRKPSWGQLVSWTCQDAREAVLEAVVALVAAAAGPRRLRGQNREGSATTQVTARMMPDELAAMETVRVDAAVRTEREVNRTLVVIGALQVATQRVKPD